MAQSTTKSPLQNLLEGQIDRESFDDLVEEIYRSFRSVDQTHDQVKELSRQIEEASGAEEQELHEKIGILHYALGEYSDALDALQQVRERREAAHFLGRTYMELRRMDDALAALEDGRRGEDDFETDVLLVDIHCFQRNPDPAREICERYEDKYEGDPRWHYAMGRELETEGQYGRAMEQYELAIDLDPEHRKALFRLALNCDMNGEDERAMKLYKRCASLQPTFLGALVNLGVLYEDHQEFERAVECYRRVLAIDPANKLARLYVKDAEASLSMFVDEERRRRAAERQAARELPVENFELSARSEHVLEKLDVHTLGELAQHTREELLEFDNFGETSLTEIKQMLARHNLRLGGESADAQIADSGLADTQSEDSMQKLDTPVELLNLSTRSSQCMERLGIDTVGELIQRTEDDLLSTPNFGRTSVSEIKTKLAEMGLGLREE
jgi:DNA-directed RNA polymerase subunit alpha